MFVSIYWFIFIHDDIAIYFTVYNLNLFIINTGKKIFFISNEKFIRVKGLRMQFIDIQYNIYFKLTATRMDKQDFL